ncbi:hypothetical protein FLJC2902T_20730 [Flavobacterium limnosediminis JC2902]|uniref:Uncharacterized protein n=1 Tax=Flavobacterium limnosediminis JC2902 TaxID=1341181 RepID=V6SKZ1_9FLAO|nr:hypothetical protein [Flavobacterium limnosediminis]ESU27368.1 hypothetical protein FLJC2902T_20730 [Flavobacterium limnosediminis JC2902]
MKKFTFFILALFIPLLGIAQEDSGQDLEQNLKEFIDNIVKNSEVFQKTKLKFFLNGKEIKNLSDYIINLNGLEMKVEKKENTENGKKEEEIEIKITVKQFNVS